MNAAQLHLLTVHLPVVGISAASALMTLALIRGSETLAKAGIGFVVCGTLFAAPAYFSGPDAMKVARQFASIDDHFVEQHAIAARIAFFASVLLAAIALKVWVDARHAPIGRGARIGLLCGMLAIAWLMAWTAHLGGIIRHPEIREPSWWLFPELPRQR